MPSDAITYSALAKELNDTLANAKAEKINMPRKDEAVILFNTASGKKYLMMAADTPRIYITENIKSNPQTPFGFCMFLRKHLSNATLKSVELMEYERIFKLTFMGITELKDKVTLYLYMEALGKYGNIILCDENDIIIDCFKKIPFDVSSVRQLLPGIKYTLPQAPGKTLITSGNGLRKLFENFEGGDLAYYLFKNIKGVSKETAEEISNLISVQLNTTADLCSKAEEAADITMEFARRIIESPSPCVLYSDEIPKGYFAVPYSSISDSFKNTSSLSAAMDTFFSFRDKTIFYREATKKLNSAVNNALQRTNKKIALQIQKIEESRDYEKDILTGDIILAEIYKIKEGSDKYKTINFYDEKLPEIEIKLDKNLSPAKNAQRYYQKAAKKKKTLEAQSAELKKSNEFLEYLNTLAASLEIFSDAEDLEEIKKEMTEMKLLPDNISHKKNKPKESVPFHYLYEGFHIYVGKNNFQNDRLTSSADKSDMWLHVLNFAGSHVIIDSEEKIIPGKVIEFAAQLAAYYSKGNGCAKIPVTCTKAKYLKKPKGALPGKFIYSNENTIIIEPKRHENYLLNK